MTEIDLERALARLADDIEPPLVSVSDDVARGRRRMYRHRMTIVGAALGTGAVVVAGGLLAGTTPDVAPDPADRVPDAQQTVEAADPTRTLPDLYDQAPNADVLTRWNDVLAEHVDPQRLHLAPFSLRTANEQTSTGADGTTSLGSRFGWTNDGEDGLGMIEISVSERLRRYDSPCGRGEVSCTDTRGPNGEPAQVGTSGELTTVQLEQADGESVVITFNPLFGNNSLVPVSGSDLTVDQLLAAAADERLDLPEPVEPSSIDPYRFQQAIVDLLDDGQELIGFPSGSSLVEGSVYERQRQVAVVTADAYPVSAGYGVPAGCDQKQFERCEHREVDGVPVFVGWTTEKFFPGVQVVAGGDQNVVRLQWETPSDGTDRSVDVDVEALVDLVTDPRWQS